MSYQSDINEFLTKMKINKCSISDSVIDKRIAHLNEEISELKMACDREEFIDALVDLVYIAIGTADMTGFDFTHHFNEVHEANMRRELQESDNHKFGVYKPIGWVGPDHSKASSIYDINIEKNNEI